MARSSRPTALAGFGAILLVPAMALAQAPAQQIPQAADRGSGGGAAIAQAPPEGRILPEEPRGRVRIQGRDREGPAAPIVAPAGIDIDPREQMRRFIQSISTFARRYRRNFPIITHGGLELLVKRDPVDETRVNPARAYMRSIDGVIQEGLFFDRRIFGEPPPQSRQARNLRLTEMAKANGLKVFVMDFGNDPKTVDESHRRNKEKGYVSITAHAPPPELNSLPPYPPRPFDASGASIVSLGKVANFAYLANSQAFGRVDEFALKMHATNYDLLIVDVFHGLKPLSRRAVETLKFKQTGAKRLVFATVDIGSAASYRYYWKPRWREGSPLWISAPFRDDPDRYHVQFWRPEWQRLISGDTQSYVYGIIAQGFDGVVLEGIEEAYRFFEGGAQEQEEEETPPAPTAAATPKPAAEGTPAAETEPAPVAAPLPLVPGAPAQ